MLPLIPAYLTHITGASFGPNAPGGAPGASPPAGFGAGRAPLPAHAPGGWQTILAALFFVAGFSAVFIAFGATASALGELLSFNQATIRRVAAVLVVFFGLHTAGLLRLPWLDRERRAAFRPSRPGLLNSLWIGMAFAAGWTPCVGPILGSILLYAGTEATLWRGVALLSAYSAGLAAPFLLLALLLGRVSAVVPAIARRGAWIERASGVFLIGIGLMLYFDIFLLLPQWFNYYRWLPN